MDIVMSAPPSPILGATTPPEAEMIVQFDEMTLDEQPPAPPVADEQPQEELNMQHHIFPLSPPNPTTLFHQFPTDWDNKWLFHSDLPQNIPSEQEDEGQVGPLAQIFGSLGLRTDHPTTQRHQNHHGLALPTIPQFQVKVRRVEVAPHRKFAEFSHSTAEHLLYERDGEVSADIAHGETIFAYIPRPGDVLGNLPAKYLVKRYLGKSTKTNSVVVEIEDTRDNLRYAAKVIPIPEQFEGRVLLEARILASLRRIESEDRKFRNRHGHVVKLYDVFRHGAHVVFILELLGESLADIVNNGRPQLNGAAIRYITKELMELLYRLKYTGVTHRSISPDKIRVRVGTNGRPELVLCGLTSATLDTSSDTGVTLLRNSFAAPEVGLNLPCSSSMDTFSAGLIIVAVASHDLKLLPDVCTNIFRHNRMEQLFGAAPDELRRRVEAEIASKQWERDGYVAYKLKQRRLKMEKTAKDNGVPVAAVDANGLNEGQAKAIFVAHANLPLFDGFDTVLDPNDLSPNLVPLEDMFTGQPNFVRLVRSLCHWLPELRWKPVSVGEVVEPYITLPLQ